MPLPQRLAAGARLLLLGAIAAVSTAALGEDPAMPAGHMMMPPPTGAGAADTRTAVHFPPAFKQQELANMRSHLEALQQITRDLAEGNFQAASDTAAARLTRGGMSGHDRHQAAHYMPKKMLAMGQAMHRAAGHLAEVAQDAAVTGEIRPTLRALSEVQARCIACHAAYRMQ